MRLVRWTVAGVTGGIVSMALLGLVPGTAPVAAEIEGDQGCQATAWFRDADVVVDVASIGADEVVTVRRSDTVDWQASVAAPPGDHEGSVWVDLPPPLGRVEIDSWSGSTSARSSSGTEEYDLPKAVPAGVRFTVSGEHRDDQGTCTGTVTLAIEGSPWSSPVTWAGLGATAATGVGLAMAMRPVFTRVSGPGTTVGGTGRGAAPGSGPGTEGVV